MKLNLGCGSQILENYINIDKFKLDNVDVVHDLEKFPYPFEDDSIIKILMCHVLEHLGQNFDIFNNIIKELYRICKKGAIIDIRVPHPRHEDFISDPTHVRPITKLGLSLYDKSLNLTWKQQKASNTHLGLIHDLNMRIIDTEYVLEGELLEQLKKGEITKKKLEFMMKHSNNIIKETRFKWQVIK